MEDDVPFQLGDLGEPSDNFQGCTDRHRQGDTMFREGEE